jgi:hypothetical protein
MTIGEGEGWASWNLSNNQISITHDIKAIYATPIKAGQNNEKMIGILSIDANHEFLFDDPSKGKVIDFFKYNDQFMEITEIAKKFISKMLVYFHIVFTME